MYEHITNPNLIPEEGEVLAECEPIDERRHDKGLCVVPMMTFSEDALMPDYVLVNYPAGGVSWEFAGNFRFKRIIK
jgi:hypothetical protein